MAQAPAEGMIRKVCTQDHDELGHLEFDVPEGLDIKTCPWHNADGSFDREAWRESETKYVIVTPNYPNVLRALLVAVANGQHENPTQAICSIMDITRFLALTEPETVDQLLKEFGYRA
jgi:hypothetical protein